MLHQCKASDYQVLISTMLQRQHALIQVIADLDVSAGTDITGFGLAGHLIEMLSASKVKAMIDLSTIPLLPGTIDAIDQGIESTLAPTNRYVLRQILTPPQAEARPEFKALFDPQTCGGLLLGVPAGAAQEFERRLLEAGSQCCVRIGEVCVDLEGEALLRIV